LNKRRVLTNIVKVTITILSLAAVLFFGKINFQVLLKQLSNIDLKYYIASLMIVNLVVIYLTRRWNCLLLARDHSVPYSHLVGINFIGCFFNLFMPSSFGGDVARVTYLKKASVSWKDSASSVFLDRFLGLLSLLFLAFFSLMIKIFAEKEDNSVAGMYMIIGVTTVFLGWLLIMNLHRIIRKLFSSKSEFMQRFLTKYETFSVSLNILNYPKKIIIKGFILSLIANILTIIAVHLIILSLGLEIGILPILITFPLVTVVSMIPVSIGGIGIREGAFVFFLSGYSVSSEDALALSLLYFSSIVFLGIIGGIIFSFSKYLLEKTSLE
jgi:uncharacterized protein (TIRG00374 family)